MYVQYIYGMWGSFLRSVWEEFVGQVWEWESWSSHCHTWGAFPAFISGRKCQRSFFASGFGSGTSSPAAPGQFNIQEEHWKVREVSKSSNNNYKHGKQNLELQIQEAFWFFEDLLKGWLICQCSHIPGLRLREGKWEWCYWKLWRE